MKPFDVVKWTWRHPLNRGHRLRALVVAAVHQVRSRVIASPHPVPLGDSSRIWAVRGRTASTKQFYANPPDIEMLIWQRVLETGSLFVDVGANVGPYTIIACANGARVIAIEPSEGAVWWLRRNLSLNGYSADIRQMALADEAGTGQLTVGLDTTNRLIHEGGQPVEITTLDDVLNGQTACAKIDVEGAELRVLMGAVASLQSHDLKLIQLEWLVNRCEIRGLLDRFGYSLFHAGPAGTLVPGTGQDAQNVFAVAPKFDVSSLAD